jgi:Galactose oxidase, central domain
VFVAASLSSEHAVCRGRQRTSQLAGVLSHLQTCRGPASSIRNQPFTPIWRVSASLLSSKSPWAGTKRHASRGGNCTVALDGAPMRCSTSSPISAGADVPRLSYLFAALQEIAKEHSRRPGLPRSGHCSVTLPKEHSADVLMFGGYTETADKQRQACNETWVLDSIRDSWSQLQTVGSPPRVRPMRTQCPLHPTDAACISHITCRLLSLLL